MGQSRSAFVTSSLENFPAVGGFHSFAEAMNFLSMQFFGLIGSFHLFPLLFTKNKVCGFAVLLGTGNPRKKAKTLNVIVYPINSLFVNHFFKIPK